MEVFDPVQDMAIFMYWNMRGGKTVDGSVEIINQTLDSCYCDIRTRQPVRRSMAVPCAISFTSVHTRHRNIAVHLRRNVSKSIFPVFRTLYSVLNDCIPDHAVFRYLSGIRTILDIWPQINLIDQPTVQHFFYTLHTEGSLFWSITLFQVVDWISEPSKSQKSRRHAIPE